MYEIEPIVNKLIQLDDEITSIKDQKKKVDEKIKLLEEGLIMICEKNNIDIETATGGKYNIKPNTGRKLKKSN